MLRPALKKNVRSDISLPLTSKDIVATIHPVCDLEEGERRAQVSLTSANGCRDADVALLNPESWIELREWKREDG